MSETENLGPIAGRYVNLRFQGQSLKVYFEESGEGPPLLCLHTAGADSRQYHSLMEDLDLQRDWRIIAFDLPYHGRSMPPVRWWKEEYLLTTGAYAGLVESFVKALGLESPVVLGCSMGGAIALELARRSPETFDGAIALEAANKVHGRFADWSIQPDVDGSEATASWTYPLMAPQSPEESRRAVWWIYAQGGPGVYRGDTYFYSVDWDLRGKEHEIDTNACPVYLLTGEYDYACTPDESEATAAAIPGARYQTMRCIGHFPMTENYPRFREYLLPILREVHEGELKTDLPL